jgi:methionyl-tRNA formyltransferase
VRVVFFGTPDFAVPSLAALVGEGFDVQTVVTQPDRPQGRSRSSLVPPPVKIAAETEELPILQPERATDPELAAALRELAPDVGVVVAYGHLLRPDLLAIPRHGMVNVHPSLLPELRGAAPIPWTIINGLTQSGVSIIQMEAGMDSGPILRQIAEPVPADITGGELATHFAELGAEALVEALTLLEEGAVTPVVQDAARATFAPKLTRVNTRIAWTGDAGAVGRWVRARDPEPGAWTELRGQSVKLFGPRAAEGEGPAGEVLRADEQLVVGTRKGALAFEEVQPAGRRRQTASEWIRGRGVGRGERFQ